MTMVRSCSSGQALTILQNALPGPLYVFVDVIGQHMDVWVLEQDFRQSRQVLLGVGDTGGIARTVQHQQFCARCDGVSQLVRLQLESLIDVGVHNNWLAT